MPNQHAATRQAVTFRLDGEVLQRAKDRAKILGVTLTSVVEQALDEFAPAPVTTPPPAGQPDR